MYPLENPDRRSGFVSLEMADQVAVCRVPYGCPLISGLLDPVFSEKGNPGIDRFPDTLYRDGFTDRHQLDIIPPRTPRGFRYSA
jgi:hypothetical protein